jgi:predicted Zn-dependent peptidase
MYRKTVLDNGLRIVTEKIDHVRSASIGIWVQCGSRSEDIETNGTAHFIEHMLFKGTAGRSAFDIASEIDSMGGVINAYTGKELTSFYVKVPDYHMSRAIGVLSDLFLNSLLDPDEIEKEKSVVLQEISLIEDTPDDYIHDFFGNIFWDGHPLGFPVIGTRETVSRFHRDGLLSFFRDKYRANRVVVAATGNIDHDRFADEIGSSLGLLEGNGKGRIPDNPVPCSRTGVRFRELEQVHLLIGTAGPSFTSPLRYAGYLINAVLGGSMSSRLFQEIREKRGLAYAVHSFLVSYEDAGKIAFYAGTGEDKIREVVGLIFSELDRFRTVDLTEKELHSAKEQIKGNFLLGMESTDSRMTRLAKNEIYFGRNITIDETLERIDAVAAGEVREFAADVLDPATAVVTALGRISEDDLFPPEWKAKRAG